MKALSLWQPWASLWLSPRKVHETRHWSMQVPRDGFWLAVHAAKKPMRHEGMRLDEICDEEFGREWVVSLPRGAIIGRVFITSCRSTNNALFVDEVAAGADDFECGNWEPGRFAFRRTEYRLLKQPIPFRGMQSMFTVPDWSPDLELANR